MLNIYFNTCINNKYLENETNLLEKFTFLYTFYFQWILNDKF